MSCPQPRQVQPRARTPKEHRQLNRRMAAYALAAAGAAAFVPNAHAEVVYTAVKYPLLHGPYALDIDNDGTPDFRIGLYLRGYPSSSYANVLKLKGLPGHGSSALGKQAGDQVSAWDAPMNWSIGSDSPVPFVNVQRTDGALMAFLGPHQTLRGPWQNVTNRYLGLKFVQNGETHYGWARLTTFVVAGVLHANLTGYAYETTPNMAILAGDEGLGASAKRQSSPSPQATLGILSLGAVGLSLWKRKNS